tara:strand:- start:57489 stop:58073 length:585 start_codon:yes stop_codon:yes gene_type:complete
MAHFYAYLNRMKLIERWSLMHSVRKENVQEHSLQVAVIAHALALIKNKYFDGNVDANKIATMAIFHDASEVITGDLPTPIKYFNPKIEDAYHAIENYAMEKLLSYLPEELREEYKGLLTQENCDPEETVLVKAADTLSAYIKCMEEKTAGNNEFNRARISLENKIRSYKRPEVDHFMANYINSFSLTLDELSTP